MWVLAQWGHRSLNSKDQDFASETRIRSNVSGNALFGRGAKNFQWVLATTWDPQFGVPHLGAWIKDGAPLSPQQQVKLPLPYTFLCRLPDSPNPVHARTRSPAPSIALPEAIAPICAEVFACSHVNGSTNPFLVRSSAHPGHVETPMRSKKAPPKRGQSWDQDHPSRRSGLPALRCRALRKFARSPVDRTACGGIGFSVDFPTVQAFRRSAAALVARMRPPKPTGMR